MTDPVRVAVIGTGWWATATHIPALQDDPNADLIALCDANQERVQAAGAAYGVERVYTDHRVLLEKERPDAVVVATTHATHFAVAMDCLNAGAHVLIEKPLTLFASDARQLVERAAQVGQTVIVGYPWNYMSHAKQIRERLASGSLGPIQCVQCVFNSYNADLIGGKDRSDQPGSYPVHGPGDVYSRKEASGGGHGHLQITHVAGLLFFVTGLRASGVQARMANHGLPLDLVDMMLVTFANGALGTVSGTSNAFLPQSRLTIGCTNGSVEMDVLAGTTRIKTTDGAEEVLPPAADGDLRFAPVRNLVGIAQGTEDAGSPVEAAWRAVELLDAAYRSAEADGRYVPVEELYASQG